MRKIKLLLMTLLITAGSVCGYADIFIGNLYYYLGENTATVTGFANSSVTELVIPAEIENGGAAYPVTSIGDYAFNGCAGLTSVTIPNSVTSIGDYAFYECTGLTSVTIPNSVTSIGEWAFYGCSSLTSVTIPNYVTSIGSHAFYGCSGLTSVTIGNSVTSIGRATFQGCTALTSVTIPNSVTVIEQYAFDGCSSLTSVTIPNYVTSIGDCAFSDCSGLTSVIIGNSVKSIGYEAFGYCSNITSVTIPESVTNIGNYAFSYCTGLTSVTIPNSVTSIGNNAFSYCSGLASVAIGNSVTSIGNGAFEYCTALTSVTIPNSMTSIGSYAFNGCDKLSSVFSEITEPFAFGEHAFYNTSNNCVLYVPQGTRDAYIAAGWTEDIFRGGFADAYATSILLLENLTFTKIGEKLQLFATVFPDDAIQKVQWSSENDNIATVSDDGTVTAVGKGETNIYAKTIDGTNIEAVCNVKVDLPMYVLLYSIDEDNKTACVDRVRSGDGINDLGEDCHVITIPEEITVNNIVYKVTKIGTWAFSSKKGLTSVKMPNTLTEIGYGAFSDCSGLTAINIPNSVTYIGHGAFQECTGLSSVTIPNSVEEIADWAFEGCTGLKHLCVKTTYAKIHYQAFDNCPSLKKVEFYYNNYVENSKTWGVDGLFISLSELFGKQVEEYILGENLHEIGDLTFSGCEGLKSITIPDNVHNIGVNAFNGCIGLTSINIPASVTNVGQFAFQNCTGLKEVSIPSTTDIGNYAFNGCTSLKSVSFPDNKVAGIGAYAFKDCIGLTSFTLPRITSIGLRCFDGCTNLCLVESLHENPFSNDVRLYPGFVPENTDLIVPAGSAEKYRSAEGWKDFRSIREKVETSKYVYAVDSYDKDNAVIYGSNDTSATVVDIPNYMKYDGTEYAVTEIAANAFADYEKMENVVIPDDITRIGDAAFENCISLQAVVLPAMTTEIGDNAFAGCLAMTEVKALSPAPPAISEGTFSEETLMNATLYVPIGYAVVYENAPYWGRFAYISEKDMSDEVTTISDVSADSQATIVSIYTPSGSRLNADSVDGLGKGIYIFRYNDGKSEKVVVK